MIASRPAIGRRSTLAALALSLAVAGSCGGSDSGGDGAPECRTEVVEDEYGFEVEIEVCDDE